VVRALIRFTILFGLYLGISTGDVSFAQCTGQFQAGQACINPSNSQGEPTGGTTFPALMTFSLGLTGALPWVQANNYNAGSSGSIINAVRGTFATSNSDGIATAIVQSTANFNGITPALYVSSRKRGAQGQMSGAYGIGIWAEGVDNTGGGSVSGGRLTASCVGGTSGNCTGATNVGVASVPYSYIIGSEDQVLNNSSNATLPFSAAKFAVPVVGTCAGTFKCDAIFAANPNIVAPNVSITPALSGIVFSAGTIDTTGSILNATTSTTTGINLSGATCSTSCFSSPNFQVDGSGNVITNGAQVVELTATGAAISVTSGKISYGGTTVAAGSGTCPTGTVGGQTVQGCIVINIAGTSRNLPFF
jgi:hypothetical protein